MAKRKGKNKKPSRWARPSRFRETEEERLQRQHDNRERLYAGLDSKTAKFARSEFAKLGLL
jgi:hypothetical protein